MDKPAKIVYELKIVDTDYVQGVLEDFAKLIYVCLNKSEHEIVEMAVSMSNKYTAKEESCPDKSISD